MNKLFFSVIFLTIATVGFSQWEYDTIPEGNRAAVMAAQEREQKQQQVQNPWFFGGGLIAGFGSGGGAFGISPLVGYKVNNYVDAGLGLNLVYNYNRTRYWDGTPSGDKNRAFNVGLMPFVRVFPVNNLFAQLQFEQAWVNGSYMQGGSKYKYNYDYQALIASLGYANRVNGRVGFFISVGIDLLRDPNSPYRYSDGRIMPVIATGVNF